MHERFSPQQLEIAEKLSRRFEIAWRVTAHPGNYSREETNEAMDFLEDVGKKLVQSIHEDIDPEIFELLNSVFLGLFHRNITLPQDLKRKPLSSN